MQGWSITYHTYTLNKTHRCPYVLTCRRVNAMLWIVLCLHQESEPIGCTANLTFQKAIHGSGRNKHIWYYLVSQHTICCSVKYICTRTQLHRDCHKTTHALIKFLTQVHMHLLISHTSTYALTNFSHQYACSLTKFLPQVHMHLLISHTSMHALTNFSHNTHALTNFSHQYTCILTVHKHVYRRNMSTHLTEQAAPSKCTCTRVSTSFIWMAGTVGSNTCPVHLY